MARLLIRLEKAGPKRQFEEQSHPREQAGTHGSKYRGGEFVPKGTGGAGTGEPGSGEMIELNYQASNAKRLWQLETQNTYKWDNYPVLAIREMVQNSVDAIRKQMQSGTLGAKQGRLDITMDQPNKTVSVKDNGIGMDLGTIQNVFLDLGGTTKHAGGETIGGLGVAKAIILGVSGDPDRNEDPDWTIRSRDALVNADQIGKPLPRSAFHAEFQEGAEITVRKMRNYLQGSWDRVKELMGSSELPGIAITMNGEAVPYQFAGRRAQKMEVGNGVWASAEKEQGGKTVTIRTTAEVKSYKAQPGEEGAIFVRLRGQTQFIDKPSKNLPFNACVVVDLETNAVPGTEHYPFSKGRDSVRGACATKLQAIKDYLEQEVHSAGHEAEIEEEYFGDIPDPYGTGRVVEYNPHTGESKQIGTNGKVPGQTHVTESGKLATVVDRPHSERSAIERAMDSAEARIAPVCQELAIPERRTRWKVSKNTLDVKGKFNLEEEAGLLAAWGATVRLVAQAWGPERISYKPIGAGFVLDARTQAEAHGGAEPFVLLNPIITADVRKESRTRQNPYLLANHLFQLACHELAHHAAGMWAGHSEDFTVTREDIGLKTGWVLPGIVKLCEAAMPAQGTKRDIKTVKAGDARYEKTAEAARERARAYHARQKAIAEVAKEIGVSVSQLWEEVARYHYGDPHSTFVAEAKKRDDYIKGTPEDVKRRIREATRNMIGGGYSW